MILDSSLDRLSLGLSKDAAFVASYSVEMTMETMEHCMAEIDAFLKAQNITVADLGFLGVIEGPGGYTSLRLGISTMKTIAQMQDIPLFGRTIYDAMMMGVLADQVYFGVIPGRKHHVNCQLNRVVDGYVEILSESLSLTYDQFYNFVTKFKAPIKCRCLGGDAFVQTLKDLGETTLIWDTSPIQLEGLLAFGAKQLADGMTPVLSDIQPLYAHDVV